MNFKIITPEIPKNSKGVYDIVFKTEVDSYTYIGSSKNLKKRIITWKSLINCGKPKNDKMCELLPLCKEIKFEIVEFLEEEQHLATVERYYILYDYWLGLHKNVINEFIPITRRGDKLDTQSVFYYGRPIPA